VTFLLNKKKKGVLIAGSNKRNFSGVYFSFNDTCERDQPFTPQGPLQGPLIFVTQLNDGHSE